VEPAGEKRGRRFRTIGDLEVRISLFLAGVFLLSPWYWALFGATSWHHWFAYSILLFLSSCAAFFLYAALFGSERFLGKARDAVGSRAVVIVFFLVAVPIARVIRHLDRK
jgi:hypothetical protein